MGDLAQQIYLGQMAQQQAAGAPMRGMMQQQPQMPMQQPGNPYDMQAINEARRSMGLGAGHKPITPGFLDMLGAVGGFMGLRSKNPEVAHLSGHHLANFGAQTRAREAERLAINKEIMESLRHAAKDQEDRAYRHATLGETVRNHNLTAEEHKLMRDFNKAENEAKRANKDLDREETKRHHAANEEDRKLRREEMGAQNSHLNRKEIDGAKENLKIGNEAALGLKSVNKMIDFFEKNPLGTNRLNPANIQTLNALRKDVLVHEIKKLPAKGQNRALQQQINNAIPGMSWTQKAALETLQMKKEELLEQIAAKEAAQELIDSFKGGKKSSTTVEFIDKKGNPFKMTNATPEDIAAAEESGEYTRVR